MDTELITILIPAYKPDIAKFDECLKSIRSQGTYQPEIIIGIQGDTDLSEIAKKYKCQLVHFDEPSSYKTRIRLIPYAKGEYIWYVDCDDKILSHSIDELIVLISEFERQQPDIICFKSGGLFNEPKNASENRLILGNKDIVSTFYKTDLIDNYMFEKIFKTNLLNKIIFPNIDIFYGDDQISTKAILEKAESLLVSDKEFYAYSGPSGSSPKKWNYERMIKTSYIVKYVENKAYNDKNVACKRNINIVWIYLSSLFLTLGNCRVSKSQCEQIRNSDAFKIVENYIKGADHRPKITFALPKDRIKTFLFKLFSNDHYLLAKSIAKTFARLKKY